MSSGSRHDHPDPETLWEGLPEAFRLRGLNLHARLQATCDRRPGRTLAQAFEVWNRSAAAAYLSSHGWTRSRSEAEATDDSCLLAASLASVHLDDPPPQLAAAAFASVAVVLTAHFVKHERCCAVLRHCAEALQRPGMLVAVDAAHGAALPQYIQAALRTEDPQLLPSVWRALPFIVEAAAYAEPDDPQAVSRAVGVPDALCSISWYSHAAGGLHQLWQHELEVVDDVIALANRIDETIQQLRPAASFAEAATIREAQPDASGLDDLAAALHKCLQGLQALLRGSEAALTEMQADAIAAIADTLLERLLGTKLKTATEAQRHFVQLKEMPQAAWVARQPPMAWQRTASTLAGCGGLLAAAWRRCGEPTERQEWVQQLLLQQIGRSPDKSMTPASHVAALHSFATAQDAFVRSQFGGDTALDGAAALGGEAAGCGSGGGAPAEVTAAAVKPSALPQSASVADSRTVNCADAAEDSASSSSSSSSNAAGEGIGGQQPGSSGSTNGSSAAWDRLPWQLCTRLLQLVLSRCNQLESGSGDMWQLDTGMQIVGDAQQVAAGTAADQPETIAMLASRTAGFAASSLCCMHKDIVSDAGGWQKAGSTEAVAAIMWLHDSSALEQLVNYLQWDAEHVAQSHTISDNQHMGRPQPGRQLHLSGGLIDGTATAGGSGGGGGGSGGGGGASSCIVAGSFVAAAGLLHSATLLLAQPDSWPRPPSDGLVQTLTAAAAAVLEFEYKERMLARRTAVAPPHKAPAGQVQWTAMACAMVTALLPHLLRIDAGAQPAKDPHLSEAQQLMMSQLLGALLLALLQLGGSQPPPLQSATDARQLVTVGFMWRLWTPQATTAPKTTEYCIRCLSWTRHSATMMGCCFLASSAVSFREQAEALLALAQHHGGARALLLRPFPGFGGNWFAVRRVLARRLPSSVSKAPGVRAALDAIGAALEQPAASGAPSAGSAGGAAERTPAAGNAASGASSALPTEDTAAGGPSKAARKRAARRRAATEVPAAAATSASAAVAAAPLAAAAAGASAAAASAAAASQLAHAAATDAIGAVESPHGVSDAAAAAGTAAKSDSQSNGAAACQRQASLAMSAAACADTAVGDSMGVEQTDPALEKLELKADARSTGGNAAVYAPSIPSWALCPLMQAVMSDPVICSGDGQSYERAAIEAWLQQQEVSPVTRQPLATAHLMPNHALRALIQRLQENGSSG